MSQGGISGDIPREMAEGARPVCPEEGALGSQTVCFRSRRAGPEEDEVGAFRSPEANVMSSGGRSQGLPEEGLSKGDSWPVMGDGGCLNSLPYPRVCRGGRARDFPGSSREAGLRGHHMSLLGKKNL